MSCCEPGPQMRRMFVHQGGCACCGSGGHGGHAFARRFETRQERRAALESYLAELKAEVQAVEERLSELGG